MPHSEQKCAHFCSEWSIVEYGTGAFCVFLNYSIVRDVHYGMEMLSELLVLCEGNPPVTGEFPSYTTKNVS